MTVHVTFYVPHPCPVIENVVSFLPIGTEEPEKASLE
jgi:hypothetical protein